MKCGFLVVYHFWWQLSVIMEKASVMHQDLSGKALWGSQSLDLCKVTAVAVHAFFSEETSMHWKCQVTEAARSPSVYSKQNKRQKSQHRTWYITCVSLILKSYRCLYLFLSNTVAFQSTSELLCVCLTNLCQPEEFQSWINLYHLPLWLQPVQIFSHMVWFSYTYLPVLSSPSVLGACPFLPLGFRYMLRHD